MINSSTAEEELENEMKNVTDDPGKVEFGAK
jgi:hypothetical protein